MNKNTNTHGATFDPYLTWLGIRDPQRPPNHYRLLGLELFESDPEVIAAAADRQMTYVRTYQAGQHGEQSQRLLNELTTAKLCLLKPERKRDYDQRLQAAQKPVGPPLAQPPQVRPQAATVTARPMPIASPSMSPSFAAPEPPFAGVPRNHGTQSLSAPKSNAVMQWSIVGGLVLAVVILAVVLANKHGDDPTPVAEKPVAEKTTPRQETSPITKRKPAATNVESASEIDGASSSLTKTSEPLSPEGQSPIASEPADSSLTTKVDPATERPGPAKDPLPNVPLPGIEPNAPAASSPKPMPANAAAEINTASATPTVPALTANDDPLNTLPTTSGNPPAMPAGNPPNPLAEPPNPLAMPNPLDVPAPGPVMPQPAPARRPIPSTKEIADNRATLREIYKTAYAAKEATLSKDLLKLAKESNDKPAVMYTAYDEARFVAAALNDFDTILAVHEELTREFAVDQDKDLLETIKLMAKSGPAMSAENAGSVLDTIHERAVAAIQDQRLETAEQLLRYVSSFSARVSDKPQRETVFRELQKRLSEHKAFAPKAAQYKEVLAKNPDDGDANLELGKFWAFQQGNYKLGLTYLAKGSDTEIREAAKSELTVPVESPEFGKVGAAWWEVANKLPPDPKASVKVHAAYCYARALPQLKALDRGLAETRINEAYKLFKPSNPEVKEIIKLLLTRSNWKMQWKGRALDETLGFNISGSCTSEEYPTWKLLDNMGVVCFRDRERMGNPFGGFGGFGKKGPPFGKGRNSNNIDTAKLEDLTKNVMQIVILASNRIDVRVLDGEGKLRSEGTGTPE